MRRATWSFDQAWFIWKDLPDDGASSPVLVPQTRSISLLVFNSRTTDCQLTWGGSQSYPLFTFTAVAEPSVTVLPVLTGPSRIYSLCVKRYEHLRPIFQCYLLGVRLTDAFPPYFLWKLTRLPFKWIFLNHSFRRVISRLIQPEAHVVASESETQTWKSSRRFRLGCCFSSRWRTVGGVGKRQENIVSLPA